MADERDPTSAGGEDPWPLTPEPPDLERRRFLKLLALGSGAGLLTGGAALGVFGPPRLLRPAGWGMRTVGAICVPPAPAPPAPTPPAPIQQRIR